MTAYFASATTQVFYVCKLVQLIKRTVTFELKTNIRGICSRPILLYNVSQQARKRAYTVQSSNSHRHKYQYLLPTEVLLTFLTSWPVNTCVYMGTLPNLIWNTKNKLRSEYWCGERHIMVDCFKRMNTNNRFCFLSRYFTSKQTYNICSFHILNHGGTKPPFSQKCILSIFYSFFQKWILHPFSMSPFLYIYSLHFLCLLFPKNIFSNFYTSVFSIFYFLTFFYTSFFKILFSSFFWIFYPHLFLYLLFLQNIFSIVFLCLIFLEKA